MNRRSTMLVAVVALLASAVPALAQGAQPLRVAVANTGRIFREMQESKDIAQARQSRRQQLQQELRQKEENVRALQADRDQLRPESAQYQERNQELLRAAVELRAWGELQQAELQRQEKVQAKALFDKIEAAVAQVAQQKGIDLVLADQRTEITNLDQLTIEQLSGLLSQRDVLYSVPQADITADVLAQLDQQYKAGGAGAPQPQQ